MAVPKKRTSKAKKRTHKTYWKNKSSNIIKKSLSLAKSLLKNKKINFIIK